MRSPNPEEVKLAREKAGLTQQQAAELIYKDESAWRRYETDKAKKSARSMELAYFELFLLKTGQELKNVMKYNI